LRLLIAQGCGRSRRMITRDPSGHGVRSNRSTCVMSLPEQHRVSAGSSHTPAVGCLRVRWDLV